MEEKKLMMFESFINESGELRIVLDAEDFKKLVNGEEASSKEIHAGPNYRIILSDIGFDAMRKIIDEAEKKHA